MPRSGGGRSGGGAGRGPSRPSAPAPARAPQQQQQRGMTTTANPSRTQQQQAGQSPGLFGQMASTAAGVAVGSSIGHAIGGFFGGGGSSAQEAAPPAQSSYESQAYQGNSTDAYAQPMDTGMYNYNTNSSTYGQQQASGPCAADTMKFTQCFDKTGGDMGACGFYLEQLKACQQAARNYAS